MQNIVERQKARNQSQTLADIYQKNINILKVTEDSQNIDIDTDFKDNFDEEIKFANPRVRFKAHGLIDSSDEESKVDMHDNPQPSTATGVKQPRKPNLNE